MKRKVSVIDMKNERYGVLFDLDGVIIDSETEYTRIWEMINREFPTGYEDFPDRIKGTTLELILSQYYPDENVRRSVEARLYEEEAKMKYKYCLDAKGFLEALKDANIPMALFTSSNEIKMDHLYLQHPEIRDMFDVIVTGDMVCHSKPAPEGYILAAHRLGMPSENCVVIEDALQGVKAGRAAGGKVIGVAGTLPADVLRPYCDIIVNNLGELSVEKIGALFSNSTFACES